MDTRASTLARVSVIPVIIALLINAVLIAPIVPALSGSTLALSGTNFDAADGNMLDDDAGGAEVDWCTPSLDVAKQRDNQNGDDDNSFKSSAENDPVPGIDVDSIPPNKADFSNVYAASQTIGPNLFAYVAFTRYDTSGTTTLSFEFNQSGVLSSNGVTFQRTQGDLLFDFDIQAGPQSTGGYDVTIDVRTWNGNATSGAWSAPTTLPASIVEASVNEVDTITNCIDGGSLLAAQFGELAINLTGLLGEDCAAFGSVMAKSRSSQPITSNLNDLVTPIPVEFNTCATMTWQKDDQYGNPVAGATFRVTPDPFSPAHTGSLDVLDNTGQAGYTGADADPAGGSFRLDGVEPFTTPGYTICEWLAPSSNYVVDQDDCVTLPVGANATVDFGTFINILLEPDVILAKAAPTEPVLAGTSYDYGLTATNQGTLAAENVTVTDDLDDSLGVNSITPSQGSCSPLGAGNTISCNLGTLAANGGSATVTINVTATPDSCPEVDNQASVSASNEPSRHQGNNLSAVVTVDILCALIDVDKTPDDGTVDAPGTATFGIATSNNGDGAALGTTLVDDLPEVSGGWSIVANPGGATAWTDCEIRDTDHPDLGDIGEWLSCAAEDIEPGGSRTVTVGASLTTDDCGTLPNSAAVETSNDGSDSDDGLITVRCPELSIGKSTETPEVNAGDQVSYTVSLPNNGDGPANDVVVTDVLPEGVSWSETSGDCDIAGDDLTCGPMTIAASTTFSVTVTGTVDSGECPSIENSASFESSNAGSGSTAETPTQITVNCPDLELVKSGSGTVVAGASVDFVIEVDNIGDGDAYDVVMVDDLPELAIGTWSIVATDGIDLVNCDITDLPADDPDAETVLRCAIKDLAAGAGFIVTVRATTTIGDCPMLSNDALVSASNEDSDDLGNNADSHDIVVECPDVSITKDASTPSVNAGEDASFEIVVSASGDGNSENVTLTDQLEGDAADWTFAVSGDGTDSECSIGGSGMLECLFGTLEPGDEITVSSTYSTDPGDCPGISNRASVSATADVDPSDNESELVTVDVNCPDLVVDKEQVDQSGEPTDGPISAGDTAYFAIEVTNLGPGTAFGFELLDEPQSGTWTVLDDGGLSCPTEIGVGGATCMADELAPGTYTLLLSYDTSAADCGQLPNAVTVSAGNEPDAAVTTENSDSATIFVECPGLNIIKQQVDENGDPTTDPILAGDTAYFEIVVWNAGPGEAKDVVMHDELPAGLVWEFEITDGDGECFPASSQEEGGELQMSLDCELGDLEVDESVTILVWAETSRADCGALTNVATVDGSNNDDEVPPAEATILVSCPELSLIKVNDAVGSVLPGTTVTYTLMLTVSDEGLENGEATDVTVIDVMPEGLEDPTGFDPAATFEAASRTITWDLGTLGEGTYELTYQATVADDAAQGDELVNVASATSPDSQCPDLASLEPECEDDSTVVVRVPTLVIDKEADAEEIVISGPADDLVADPTIVTWTLTYTLANGPVTNAVISDELPVGLVYVDGSASDGGAYDADTNLLTWTFGTLSESGSVTFQTEVDPETISRLAPTVNVAVITSDQTPEDEDEDEVTVTVEQELGGNPTPTPMPRLPDTATGVGINGEPITIPVELLAAAFIGSLGVLALANVKARRRR